MHVQSEEIALALCFCIVLVSPGLCDDDSADVVSDEHPWMSLTRGLDRRVKLLCIQIVLFALEPNGTQMGVKMGIPMEKQSENGHTGRHATIKSALKWEFFPLTLIYPYMCTMDNTCSSGSATGPSPS